ncbi:PEP-CTERM sorting domain-containing protein [bacterium]|nr:MAG: PEP-CTERM sorting domain-containing protein [bacterium]
MTFPASSFIGGKSMRKVALSLISLAALAATTAPANAAVSISYTPGVSAVSGSQVVFEKFNTVGAVGTNSNVFNGDVTNQGKRPVGSTGGYLAVGSTGSGSYQINFATAVPVLSFLLGTLDTYNQVVLNFVNNTSQTFTGLEIVDGNGVTGAGFQDGRVTYDVGTSNPVAFISSVVFNSTSAAMEIDDVASAAPEPGTWLMMILGFGLVGASLRANRRRGKLAIA